MATKELIDASSAEPGQALNRFRELSTEFAETYPSRDEAFEFPRHEMNQLKASGLLAHAIPVEYGGMGASFYDIIESIRILAEGNPSIAQIYAVHAIILKHTGLWTENEKLKQWIFNEVTQRNALVANASSEKHSKHVVAYEVAFDRASDGGVIINGRKFFSTGSLSADLFFVPAPFEGNIAVAFVPASSAGVAIHDDWRAMGQRGTGSGTTEFQNVHVRPALVVPKFYDSQKPDPTDFFAPMFQANFGIIVLGTAQAALNWTLNYVRTKSRPWVLGGATSAVEDPYNLQSVGRMDARLSGAVCLSLEAARYIDGAIAARQHSDRDELAHLRGEAMVLVSKAKVVSTEVALYVCNEMFKVCGARSALAEERSDRFLRDVRTLTLHDPVEYKAKLIGEYLLQDKLPTPGFFN